MGNSSEKIQNGEEIEDKNEIGCCTKSSKGDKIALESRSFLNMKNAIELLHQNPVSKIYINSNSISTNQDSFILLFKELQTHPTFYSLNVNFSKKQKYEIATDLVLKLTLNLIRNSTNLKYLTIYGFLDEYSENLLYEEISQNKYLFKLNSSLFPKNPRDYYPSNLKKIVLHYRDQNDLQFINKELEMNSSLKELKFQNFIFENRDYMNNFSKYLNISTHLSRLFLFTVSFKNDLLNIFSKGLKGNNSIECLAFKWCSFIYDEGFKHFASSFKEIKNLKVLKLKLNNFSIEMLDEIGQNISNCIQLKQLSVKNESLISQSKLVSNLFDCPNLEKLTMKHFKYDNQISFNKLKSNTSVKHIVFKNVINEDKLISHFFGNNTIRKLTFFLAKSKSAELLFQYLNENTSIQTFEFFIQDNFIPQELQDLILKTLIRKNNIKELILDYQDLNLEYLVPLLSEKDSLTSLTVSSAPWEDLEKMFDLLCLNQTLKSLTLDYLIGKSLENDSYISLLSKNFSLTNINFKMRNIIMSNKYQKIVERNLDIEKIVKRDMLNRTSFLKDIEFKFINNDF